MCEFVFWFHSHTIECTCRTPLIQGQTHISFDLVHEVVLTNV